MDGPSKKDGNFVKSMIWMVHPRRMEISLKHIKWTVLSEGK